MLTNYDICIFIHITYNFQNYWNSLHTQLINIKNFPNILYSLNNPIILLNWGLITCGVPVLPSYKSFVPETWYLKCVSIKSSHFSCISQNLSLIQYILDHLSRRFNISWSLLYYVLTIQINPGSLDILIIPLLQCPIPLAAHTKGLHPSRVHLNHGMWVP